MEQNNTSMPPVTPSASPMAPPTPPVTSQPPMGVPPATYPPAQQNTHKKYYALIIWCIAAVVLIIIGIFISFGEFENQAEIDWSRSKVTESIQAAYNLKITEKGHIRNKCSDNKSYIKFESENYPDLVFYFYYQASCFDVPSKYGYWTEKNGKTYYSFGDILFELNKTKIQNLADQYRGYHTSEYRDYKLSFNSSIDRTSFANAVSDLEMIKPATNICKTNFSGDREKCKTITPVLMIGGVEGRLDSYESDLWTFTSNY